ncbi:MAG: DUF1287 domain-containing protein [Ignavibacteria bacterium]|nr:DUF1287 domain-containing protein [Ignavibacteria bacterium]
MLVYVFILFFSLTCSKENNSHGKLPNDSLVTSHSLGENQKKVLKGARKCLEDGFSYDLSMAYYVLTYKDGVNTGKKVFPGGDLNPEIGVCTDVIVRALRYGDVCDLQEEINKDISGNFSAYPMKRWGARKPDSNIDHRRVPNQMVWFERHWEIVRDNSYQPGDVIAWDMNGDGWGDHIGIVSDRFDNGEPYLIHNFPDPGYVAEEKVLNRWEIVGHYRIR